MGVIMAKGLVVVPHTRKRKTHAETQEYGIYDTAFLADRGCFTTMHMKRKPRNVRPEHRKRA
jgi:hypothetical protein